MNATAALIDAITSTGQDFEWYPTTDRMIEVVKRWIPAGAGSIMDIGAGDGRVLKSFAEKCDRAKLYGIEKSTVLIQAQPDNIIPVGTEFYEQNLACLEVDYIFCNPPYSQFEDWTARIIEQGYAKNAYLVIPQRWKDSKEIKAALTRRGAATRVIGSDNFADAERQARAVIDIVEIRYPRDSKRWDEQPTDPFDIWFDQNIDTFDQQPEVAESLINEETPRDLARGKFNESSIKDIEAAYLEEYNRLESNYRAIFKLDYAILKELGVNKEAVRDGIKKKMAGLKNKYWAILFDRLDAITSRLSTKSRDKFREKVTGATAVAFTATNAYAVVLWAIKNANKYYDEQVIDLFHDLSTGEGTINYKSNQKTWQAGGWRYRNEEMSHYALDYRFVVPKWQAIKKPGDYGFDCVGNLHRDCHALIADCIAVFSNLGFTFSAFMSRSDQRTWYAGGWQDFNDTEGRTLFQVKAHINGNLHFRFRPAAIKALNIEAGRLLGWLQSPGDVVRELGYSPEDAKRYFHCSLRITPSNIKLLTAN